MSSIKVIAALSPNKRRIGKQPKRRTAIMPSVENTLKEKRESPKKEVKNFKHQ
jgi:uncharacterized protein YpuA (DUF1002 family)